MEEGQGGFEIAIKRVKKKEEKERKEFLKSATKKSGPKFVKSWFG